jgi:hypothetical protein
MGANRQWDRENERKKEGREIEGQQK